MILRDDKRYVNNFCEGLRQPMVLAAQPGPKARVGLLLLANRPWSELLQTARLAEEEGFDCVWVPDERFFRDCFSILALVSQATFKPMVGPCVVDPYSRHPILTAAAVATLDEISGGRAVCAIGAGRSGFRELGIEYSPPPARAVREAVESIRDVLSRSQSARSVLDFAAVRDDPPIFIAAEKPAMLRLAGEAGDGVILQAKPLAKTFLAALDGVLRGRDKTTRPDVTFEIVSRLDISVSDPVSIAYDALRHRVARRLIASSPTFDPFLAADLAIPELLRDMVSVTGYTNDRAVLTSIGQQVSDEMVDVFCLAMTPKDVPQRLSAISSMGATQIIINPVPAPGHDIDEIIRLVGRWRRGVRAAVSPRPTTPSASG